MDIDQLKPITTSEVHDHMDVMLMMQMDKLPEQFTGSYNDASDNILSSHFNAQSSCTNIGANIQHFLDGPNQHAFNFPSPNVSFSCMDTNSKQEPFPEAFLYNNGTTSSGLDHLSQKKSSSMATMREMIFRIAAMQPIHIDPESVKPPKRRNVKISKDPQSVAARHRRERISEKIRILQRLVPGGTKMDTASMLDEAIHYVKFLKSQVQNLERAAASRPAGLGFPVAMSSGSFLHIGKAYHPQNVQHFYGDA